MFAPEAQINGIQPTADENFAAIRTTIATNGKVSGAHGAAGKVGILPQLSSRKFAA